MSLFNITKHIKSTFKEARTTPSRTLMSDGYYVAYKPITLSCILFMLIEMKFIHYHSCVMFEMKFMSMCND